MSDESVSEDGSEYEDGSTASDEENSTDSNESESEGEEGSSEWDSLGQSVDYAIDVQNRSMEDSTSWDDLPMGMAQTAIGDTVRDAIDSWRNSGSEDASGSESSSEDESGEESSDAENQIPDYQ